MNDKKYIDLEAAVQALNSEGITKNMRAHRKVLAIPLQTLKRYGTLTGLVC